MNMDETNMKMMLDEHAKWLMGLGGKQADFMYKKLAYATFSNADLRSVIFYGADLVGSRFSNVNLSYANFINANLKGARFTDVNFINANLRDADLRDVEFINCNFEGADLRDADLRGARFMGGNLNGALINYPICCPEKGSFIGFKKCRNNLIVELEIPKDALRSSATSRKCRCSKAKVLSITDLDGKPAVGVKKVVSLYNMSFTYKLGKTVEVEDFDENRWNECSPGIHFFITRQEAVDYDFM